MTKKTNQKKNLRDKTLSGGAWGFLNQGSSFLTQFAIGIVLARLLPVAAFGLIGLGMIVVSFGQRFVDLGLGPALIQKKDITERHIRLVFTTSIIAGVIMTGLVYFGSPLATLILEDPDVQPIVKGLSLIFFISALTIPSRALLEKRLRFRHIFYVSFTSRIIYGVSTILLAVAGYGVWSLVIGNIIQRAFTLMGSYFYVRHPLKLLFAKDEFNDLVRFGSGMTLSGIFNFFALKGDYLVIGRLLGAEALGFYTRAYALMQKPTTNFVSVISKVLFPAASKIQHKEERLRRVYLKTMNIIAFVVMPVCVLLVLIAPDLILGLYGSKWQGTIIPLQILGMFGVFRAMYNATGAFLRAKGWVYGIMSAQIIYGFTVVLSVWLGASFFGLVGASWAVGFSIIVMWITFMILSSMAMEIKAVSILKSLIPGAVISITIAIPVLIELYFMTGFTDIHIISTIIAAFSGLLVWILSTIFLPTKWLLYLPVDMLELLKDYIPKKLYVNLVHRIR